MLDIGGAYLQLNRVVPAANERFDRLDTGLDRGIARKVRLRLPQCGLRTRLEASDEQETHRARGQRRRLPIMM